MKTNGFYMGELKEINEVISRLAAAHNRDMDAARERIAELEANQVQKVGKAIHVAQTSLECEMWVCEVCKGIISTAAFDYGVPWNRNQHCQWCGAKLDWTKEDA